MREGTARQTMEPKFFLQHGRMLYAGNSPWWWKKGGNYTTRIDEAQEFTEKEADELIRTTQSSHDFKKWPAEWVRAAAHLTVDMQDLTYIARQQHQF
jgi:hypothetical protein